MAQILEELSLFTPLGIRFWDPVLEHRIGDGLRVEAWPEPGLRPIVAARRSASDIYTFQGLPGLQTIEHHSPGPGSPTATRRFIVRVRDARRRFLPAAFRVELPLPYRGVFLADSTSSPAEPAPPGFLLFAAATRRRNAWLATIRGELLDLATGRPAAHALVRVDLDGEPSYYGLADAAGRFAVFLPQPTLTDNLGGDPSSPDGPRVPLAARRWPMSLRVFREPGLEPLPGTELPDYVALLSQRPAWAWQQSPEDGGTAAPSWLGELRWGRESIVTTQGLSQLLISSSESPPNA